MNVIAMTQKGRNKAENEDRVVVGKSILADGVLCTDLEHGILAVADGVGGQNAGAVASHFVANRLCSVNEVTDEGLRAINDELLAASNKYPEQSGMATTLSGIWLADGEARLFSVGNTRVYLLQSGRYFKQLTTDDTVLQTLLTTGRLSLEDAKRFERKNEITACFGGGDPNYFKVKVHTMEVPSVPILLTSDGIHDYISVDEMEELGEEYGVSKKLCVAMIDAARKNGSVDDASIVLCVG